MPYKWGVGMNLLENLKNGDINFLDSISYIDRSILAKKVRESNEKHEIINGFLNKVIDKYPGFCFLAIYDTDEYKDSIIYILENKDIYNELNRDSLKVLLTKDYGKIWVFNNFNKVIECGVDYKDFIFKTIFSDFDNNIDIIKKFAYSNDLNVRYIVMRYLITINKHDYIYDDILNYVKIYDKEKDKTLFMNQSDLCKLAIDSFKHGNKDLYLKLKDYIFNNYKYNDLGELLLKNSYSNKDCLKEFEVKLEDECTQGDKLFLTSDTYQFVIYKRYKEYVSEHILNDFVRHVDIFKNNLNYDRKLQLMFQYRLWHDLVEDVDKYLSLSKDTTCKYITGGSCSSCYKIGDYAFKLSDRKYNIDDITGVSNYLVLKNLEEHYIKDRRDSVIAAYEIQYFLTRDAKNVPKRIIKKFESTLLELGYIYDDSFFNSKYGDNLMLLDSYLQADCKNPEDLPDWYKEYPCVIVDRDLVLKKEKVIK